VIAALADRIDCQAIESRIAAQGTRAGARAGPERALARGVRARFLDSISALA